MATALTDEYRKASEQRDVDFYNTGVLGNLTGVPVYHRKGRWYVSKGELNAQHLAEARNARGFPIFDITDVATGESATKRWPQRTWDIIEEEWEAKDEAEASAGWHLACYFCGKLCESEEALEAHEAQC